MSRTKSNTLKHQTKAGHKRVNYIIDQHVYEAFKKKAESEGKLMSFRHDKLKLFGIQFHPESILTENGKKILKNWLCIS